MYLKVVFFLLFSLFMGCDATEKNNGSDVNSGVAKAVLAGFSEEKLPGSDLTYVCRKFSDGGIIEEGYVQNGVKTGNWILYHSDTRHMKTMNNYLKGKLNGPQYEYNRRGNVDLRTTYQNGELSGLYIEYSNGRLKKEITYKNGKINGYIKEFNNREKLFRFTEYQDNALHGKAITYNEEGKIIMEYLYKNGKKISGGLVE